jgi:hypothetical protein
VIAIVPDGEPPPRQPGAVSRLALSRRTILVHITQSNRASERDSIIHVEPRHVLATWQEYVAARSQG